MIEMPPPGHFRLKVDGQTFTAMSICRQPPLASSTPWRSIQMR